LAEQQARRSKGPAALTGLLGLRADEVGSNAKADATGTNMSARNEGANATTNTDTPRPNYIDTLLHNDPYEQNMLTANASSVLEEILHVAKQGIREPNIAQKMTTWVACFCVPFFLSSIPDSVRLPVVLEILQPSLTCLASVLLCITLFVTQQEKERYHTNQDNVVLAVLSEWVTVVHVFCIPVSIWVSVYLIMKCVRSKTLSVVYCLLICFAVVRTLQVADTVDIGNGDVKKALIFVGCLNILYIIVTINFCRAENKVYTDRVGRGQGG